jgi:hypothetical protein
MAEKQQKPKRKILRAVGEPTHFTRKQLDEAIKAVKEERERKEREARAARRRSRS